MNGKDVSDMPRNSEEQPLVILDRAGNPSDEPAGQAHTASKHAIVSAALSAALGHPLSTVAIPVFVSKNHVRMEDYADAPYRSFNAFYTRPVKPAARPVDSDLCALISPCDGLLEVTESLAEDTRFTVNGEETSLPRLIGCRKLAEKFLGGTAFLFRLTDGCYHRFLYPDAARAGGTRLIQDGNNRAVTLLHTEHFGDLLQVEISTGKIENHPRGDSVMRGVEKGCFLPGGAAILLAAQKDRVKADAGIAANTARGALTLVRYGERIGHAPEE